MKIIVAGEFYISDSAGTSLHATPGDVFYFPKGSKITFDSPSFGLGFFCGQRVTGMA
jgi:ethanolamine utilization protein EutQ (cupin superfamily)